MAASETSVICILCGTPQILYSQSYSCHLLNDHGVMFGADFLMKASTHREIHLKLPQIETPSGKIFRGSIDRFCQTTSDTVCSMCQDDTTNNKKVEVKGVKSMKNKEYVTSAEEDVPMVECWLCPLCPMVYKRRYHFDYHLNSAHQLQPEEVSSAWKVSLTETEFNEKQHQALVGKIKKEPSEDNPCPDTSLDSLSKWGPKAFSTSFICNFCGEQFKRDTNYVIHIKLVHKDEPKELTTQVLDQVSHYKLDGCIYQCKICGNKFSTSTSFMRHVKEIHSLSLKQYQKEHGTPEVESGVFICKLCNRSIKHTRNIVTAHMKMVHQISWQDYVNTNQKTENTNQDASSEPKEGATNVVLFECGLCCAKVKLKKQHLDKVHQIDEEVYEDFLEGKGITGTTTCKICKKLCKDLSKHLRMSHKMMSMEEYELIPQFEDEDKGHDPTALKCYFKCEETFRKEADLLIHLNLKHADSKELSKAQAAAAEEANLKRISNSSIWCEICESILASRASFWGHITRKHQMTIQEYEAEFGQIEQDPATPFQCKLCSKQVKHQSNSINSHLKSYHDMTWAQYLNLVVNDDNSEPPSPSCPTPPSASKLVQCKLCNTSVKHIKNHLKNSHQMNLKDYEQIENIDTSDTNEEDRQGTEIINDIPVSQELVSNSFHANIRDKSLKTCNKCDQDFTTRKLFIEHCQIVHGMKFKLKSGEKLPTPLQKRKLNSSPLDSKRIKLADN